MHKETLFEYFKRKYGKKQKVKTENRVRVKPRIFKAKYLWIVGIIIGFGIFFVWMTPNLYDVLSRGDDNATTISTTVTNLVMFAVGSTVIFTVVSSFFYRKGID